MKKASISMKIQQDDNPQHLQRELYWWKVKLPKFTEQSMLGVLLYLLPIYTESEELFMWNSRKPVSFVKCIHALLVFNLMKHDEDALLHLPLWQGIYSTTFKTVKHD